MKKQYISYEMGQTIAETGIWDVRDMEDDSPVYYDCPKNHLYAVKSTYGVATRIAAQNVEVRVYPRFSFDDAVRWIREVLFIHIQIIYVNKEQWTYDLVDMNVWTDDNGNQFTCINKSEKGSYPVFETYEQAVKDAINVSVGFFKAIEVDESEVPVMSEEEYLKFCEDTEKMNVYDGRGTYDLYECDCCSNKIITTYAVKGVTPFTTKCFKCGGIMKHTHTYKCVGVGVEVLKWVRPSYQQFKTLPPYTRQHITDGGLILETELPKTEEPLEIGTITVPRIKDTLLAAMEAFCSEINQFTDTVMKTIFKIGDCIDKQLGYEPGFAATSIMEIMAINKQYKSTAQNLITLYGMDGIRMFFQFIFPKPVGKVYDIADIVRDKEYYISDITDPKPYKDYFDRKHRLPCKPIRGFRRKNNWNRTRSNPKLR